MRGLYLISIFLASSLFSYAKSDATEIPTETIAAHKMRYVEFQDALGNSQKLYFLYDDYFSADTRTISKKIPLYRAEWSENELKTVESNRIGYEQEIINKQCKLIKTTFSIKTNDEDPTDNPPNSGEIYNGDDNQPYSGIAKKGDSANDFIDKRGKNMFGFGPDHKVTYSLNDNIAQDAPISPFSSSIDFLASPSRKAPFTDFYTNPQNCLTLNIKVWPYEYLVANAERLWNSLPTKYKAACDALPESHALAEEYTNELRGRVADIAASYINNDSLSTDEFNAYEQSVLASLIIGSGFKDRFNESLNSSINTNQLETFISHWRVFLKKIAVDYVNNESNQLPSYSMLNSDTSLTNMKKSAIAHQELFSSPSKSAPAAAVGGTAASTPSKDKFEVLSENLPVEYRTEYVTALTTANDDAAKDIVYNNYNEAVLTPTEKSALLANLPKLAEFTNIAKGPFAEYKTAVLNFKSNLGVGASANSSFEQLNNATGNPDKAIDNNTSTNKYLHSIPLTGDIDIDKANAAKRDLADGESRRLNADGTAPPPKVPPPPTADPNEYRDLIAGVKVGVGVGLIAGILAFNPIAGVLIGLAGLALGWFASYVANM